MKAYYYATISFIDYQIGRILSALDDNDELENTLIIFTSDHGEYLGDYNCFGKRSMHDASSRVPLIIRYPESFPTETVCEQAVSLVDILPTIAAAAEADTAGIDLDGTDLAMVASGKCEREIVFSQFGKEDTGIYMAVSRKWKYFYSVGDGREFLFDRINDPRETRNKANLPNLHKVKEHFKQRLLEYLKKEGAESAFTETETGLDWKEYPRYDYSVLDDPDSGLILQDHDAFVLDRTEYTKTAI
jgi:arylsulfatase A-like enzyme